MLAWNLWCDVWIWKYLGQVWSRSEHVGNLAREDAHVPLDVPTISIITAPVGRHTRYLPPVMWLWQENISCQIWLKGEQVDPWTQISVLNPRNVLESIHMLSSYGSDRTCLSPSRIGIPRIQLTIWIVRGFRSTAEHRTSCTNAAKHGLKNQSLRLIDSCRIESTKSTCKPHNSS